uniref:M4 family metallopeptidase n=1 Tax=Massilia sp. S19_KUP03_FR1 TaxID=3025503 RepID=UPI002FCD9225
MDIHKIWLASSIGAALPLMLCASASAAQMMGEPVARTQQAEQAVVIQLDNRRAYNGIDQEHGFRVKSHHPGVAGTAITRAAHTYKGVRIFHGESLVVSSRTGRLLSEVRSNRGDGLGRGADNAASAPATRGRFANFSVTPVISGEDAISLAVKATAPGASHVQSPVVELIIYPVVTSVRTAAAAGKTDAQLNALDLVDQVTSYELAYLVQTRMASGNKPIFHDTIISANDGRILAQWRTLKTVAGTGKSQYNGTVPLNTTLTGATYTMLDTTRGVGGAYGGMAVTNANHGTTAGAIFANTTNTWGDGLQYVAGGVTTNANGQTAAVNAMWGLTNTYDMLKNVLGWQSLDGNNTATYIAAHVNTAYDNAYYSDACRCMYIGDGNYFKSLGALDVIGHEMGHGITAATSNLTYWGESGGLNESASDINGEMVEAYARAGGTGSTIPATGNDWVMGTDISKTGSPLRYMYKPSLDGGSPDAWSSTLGNLDVHYSSGPNNRMFYFLAQGSNATTTSNFYSAYLTQLPKAMTGIGSDKAYRIWFRALTTKFTASTNYADARAKVLLAAQELYGVGSKEATAVQRAYAAINVGADVAEATGLAIASNPAGVSVLAGATASFAVTASGGTAPYKYQWLRNGAIIAGATAASYSLVTKTADSGAVFSVKVTDSAATPASATSANATLTVTLPSVAIASQPASVSVLAGATASFAVSASGGTAPYKYQWLRNGAAIASATAASYSLVTKAADTGAVFSVKVTDSAATPTSA